MSEILADVHVYECWSSVDGIRGTDLTLGIFMRGTGTIFWP